MKLKVSVIRLAIVLATSALLASCGNSSVEVKGVQIKQWSTVSNVDLTGVDLSGTNLTGVEFNNVNLSGSNLSNATLTKTRFWETDLTGTDFSKSNLDNATFFRAKLQGASFRDASLIQSYWNADSKEDAALLGGADFEGADLSKSVIGNLEGFKFDGMRLIDGFFVNSNLQGASFIGADLQGARFTGSNLAGANFNMANLDNAKRWDGVAHCAVIDDASFDGALGASDFINVFGC